MTNPLIYDIKRTLTSKSVLILMGILILLSFTLIPSFTVTSVGPSSNFANVQVFTYYDTSGNYHFLAFAWNQFGQPVSGVTFQANLSTVLAFTQPPPARSSSPSSYDGTPSTTNNSGIAQFAINAPLNDNYTVYLSIKQSNGFSEYEPGYSQPYLQQQSNTKVIGIPANNTGVNPTSVKAIPPGEIVSISNDPFGSVTDSKNATQADIFVNWVGPNGTLPTNYSVYYKFINVTEVCTTSGDSQSCYSTGPGPEANNLSESGMVLLGKLNSYLQPFPPPKLEANLSSLSEILVGLFSPNGTLAIQTSFFSVSQFYPQQQQGVTIEQGSSYVISFFEGAFGLFIPLIAILGSYNSYGKDRVSGVLESVLSQPISRRGLSLSRFLSSFVAMSIAVSVALAVVDGIVWYYTKAFVDSSIMLSSAGAFFVELAAFIGIMMLLSHLVRSSGLLIGIGIGLFLVIDFFWEIIMALIVELSNTGFGSTGYLQILIAGEFANPAQFVALIVTYLTHAASFAGIGGGGFGFTLTPSVYGITIPSMVATGILWAALPLAGFLYLATKRD